METQQSRGLFHRINVMLNLKLEVWALLHVILRLLLWGFKE